MHRLEYKIHLLNALVFLSSYNNRDNFLPLGVGGYYIIDLYLRCLALLTPAHYRSIDSNCRTKPHKILDILFSKFYTSQ